MKLALAAILLAVLAAAPARLHAQASEIPSAAPPQPAGDAAQRGKALIDQMVEALGGQAWFNRTSMYIEGRGTTFFHGEPNPYIIEYKETRRFAASGKAEADRVGFLTERGMLVPGKKVDVVQIWKDKQGYEITYKGKTDLPKDQVEEYYRRRAHSIEEIVGTWLKQPGVMIIAEGRAMVERHIADKVTIISASNDAVTLEIDASTHLPLRSSYQSRNSQFHDFDEETETFDDYHTFGGLPTAMTMTRYKNGDMVAQRFMTKVAYNVPVDDVTFDPNSVTVKLKK